MSDTDNIPNNIAENTDNIEEPIEKIVKVGKGNRIMIPEKLENLRLAREKAASLRKTLNENKPPKIDKPKKKSKMELELENIKLIQNNVYKESITGNQDIQKEKAVVPVENHKEDVKVEVKESNANVDIPLKVEPVIESQANVQRPQIYKQGKFFCV